MPSKFLVFSAKQLLCLRNAFAKRVGQPLSHISFYCNDAEVGVSTLVTRLPFLRKGCLLLTAFFPESESLIRTCRLLCHLDSWFHANSDSGAMTFEAFSKALGQLARSKGQLCVDPKHGWEAAMGACSLDYVMKLEDFCVLSCESFECVVQIAHITEESDPLSRHVGAVSFGMQVDLTNDPEVNVGGKIRRKISGVGVFRRSLLGYGHFHGRLLLRKPLPPSMAKNSLDRTARLILLHLPAHVPHFWFRCWFWTWLACPWPFPSHESVATQRAGKDILDRAAFLSPISAPFE